MNIISNNCLGGFVYKEVLKMPYSNPLIWHAFVEPNDYSSFILDFDRLNFENIMLSKEGNELSNNFVITIDDKYKIYQHHMFFDKDADKPTVFGPNGNDIKYNHIWEYIVNNFIRRSERMKHEEKKLVLFYDPYNKIKVHQNVVDSIIKQNYYGIVFSNQKLTLNEKIKQLSVNDNWANEKYGWHNSFMKTHADNIKKIISQMDK